jgi:hypothetical protein
MKILDFMTVELRPHGRPACSHPLVFGGTFRSVWKERNYIAAMNKLGQLSSVKLTRPGNVEELVELIATNVALAVASHEKC